MTSEGLEGQLALARREINNLRQQLKSLQHLHRKECDEISNKLQNFRCLNCSEASTSSVTEPPAPRVQQIGIISTNFPEKRGTPRQAGILPETIAKLTLNNSTFTNPEHALEGLQEFSHMWILFHFHLNEAAHQKAKVAPPRLNGLRTGVFATRSPHRPSPIGLSLVKIDRIMGNTVYFSGVDMVDRTPVLDIKPYIPQYDNPHVISEFDRNFAMELQPPADGGRAMDGEENARAGVVLGAARPPLDEMSYTRLSARMGEREAPDGEEEEGAASVRVPAWVDQPPALEVVFKERALAQLAELGPEGEDKKGIISNVLREDPRSVYLRERWGSHCYVFRISELYVSCKFNDGNRTVVVYQVFQNEAPENLD